MSEQPPETRYPIIEQIAQKLASAIATVTTANGYQSQVSEVVRPATLGKMVTPKNFSVILLYGPPRRNPDLDAACDGFCLIGWTQRFQLDLSLRPSDAATLPWDQQATIFMSDVAKAITADERWGGLAAGSNLIDPEYLADAGGTFCGVGLYLDVDYQVNGNDPYTQEATPAAEAPDEET